MRVSGFDKLNHAAGDWRKKREIDAIFGDELPATTKDERDDGQSRESGSDSWLKEQVPPHHGG